MRLRRIFAMALLALGLVSCAAIKRAFSSDKSDPCPSPDEITRRYAPEGHIEELWYDCSVKGPERRRMLVYLPGDYYSSDKHYPVLYVLHGARGNEMSWIKDGNVIASTDSLMRLGELVPYIVVFPNMNQYDDDGDFGRSRYKKPFESFFDTNGAVESSFVRDVVDNVDRHYRTRREKAGRAIMGISVGAFQAAHISASFPDKFDYVALFSPFYTAPVAKSDYSAFFKHLNRKLEVQFSDPPRLYMLGIGRWDFFIMHMDTMRQRLITHDYAFEYFETPGGHDWSNWKEYYCILSRKLFKPANGSE